MSWDEIPHAFAEDPRQRWASFTPSASTTQHYQFADIVGDSERGRGGLRAVMVERSSPLRGTGGASPPSGGQGGQAPLRGGAGGQAPLAAPPWWGGMPPRSGWTRKGPRGDFWRRSTFLAGQAMSTMCLQPIARSPTGRSHSSSQTRSSRVRSPPLSAPPEDAACWSKSNRHHICASQCDEHILTASNQEEERMLNRAGSPSCAGHGRRTWWSSRVL